MASLSLTAASLDGTVIPAIPLDSVLNGVAMTAGLVVYRDSSNLLQIAGVSSATIHRALGLYANSAGAAGQPSIIWGNGTRITGFPTLVAGTTYYLDASGAISEFADLATGEYVTRVGQAITTSIFEIDIKAMELTKA
jgi:hypothetical protein